MVKHRGKYATSFMKCEELLGGDYGRHHEPSVVIE
jgi:hypothetical protein